MHHSFAWCFFFYLSFLFPPVEPGVFNCCVTRKNGGTENSMSPFEILLFYCFKECFCEHLVLENTLCAVAQGCSEAYRVVFVGQLH